MKKILLPILSLIAGALLVLSFAPIHWYLVAFIAPGLFLYCIKDARPAQAFWRGLLFGIGLFGTGTSWLYVSIHKFGNANTFLAGLITVLFILLMALYPATQGYVFSKLFRKKSNWVKCLLIFPATYVIWEWLRSYLMTGFPWLFLGYSQTGNILSGYAPILSVYGVSVVVAFISGALCLIATHSSYKSKITASIIAVVLVVAATPLHYTHWTKQLKKPITVALVQGNIPQSLKWDPQRVVKNIQKYTTTTSQYWNYNLIVWPEAAVPILANQAQGLISKLNALGKQHHSTLIFGVPIAKKNYTKFYNAIMAVGDGSGTYLKQHLVPYGEYTPLPFILKPIMKYFEIPNSDLSRGPTHQAHLTGDGINIVPFICYEVVYPFLVIDRSKDAGLMITINDDSWFGHSLASPQQLQMAQMRSIETERYMLYVSNTGITAIINPRGDIIKEAPENKLYTLTGEVKAVIGNTPVMDYSFHPLLILLSLMTLLGILLK